MTFEEYVQYREMDARMEGKKEGKTEATIEDIIELLKDYNEEISDDLKMRINAETDRAVLKIWLKTAAKSSSISEFRRLANI